MKSIIKFCISVVFLLCSQLFGQGKALLWKVDRKDLAKPSYIFGTMHLISAEKFNIGKPLLKVLKKADKHIFEMDLSKISPETVLKTQIAEGKTLKDFSTPEQYASISSFFLDTLKISTSEWAVYERLQPIFLAQTLSQSSTDLSSGKTKSYELEIMQLSNLEQIEIGGLETLEDQLGFFEAIPYAEQVQMVIELIQSKQSAENQIKELEDIYITHNLDAIDAYMQSKMGKESEMNSILLSNRNLNWIPKLEILFKESNVVVSVGAAHLVGNQGIIKLLKDKGYTVSPIW